jgi:hypothetical protein
MAELRELIEQYVKRVKDLAEIVKGNEQATKQSLIGPFFTMLGYDLTDPRAAEIAALGSLFEAAYTHVKQDRAAADE